MGIVVAASNEQFFEVKKVATQKNLDTINDILTKGTKNDILEFVKNKNILNNEIFTFDQIYYLLRDKDFYVELIKILRNRKIFDYTTWSYSIFHGDQESYKEFMNCSETVNVLSEQFKYLKTNLVEVNSIRFLEYHPIANSRVHLLHSDKSNILNQQFRE